MADGTPIEWTEATWNPIVGCTIDTPGCINCYAMRMAARIDAMGTAPHYTGTTKKVKGKAVWTGKLALAPDSTLTQPLRWKKPRTIFVNSMGDLFHEDVPDEWIDRVFAVMALAPQHTFQVLTKRAARMRAYVSGFECDGARRFHIADAAGRLMDDGDNAHDYVANIAWPIPNVWLGVSAERQKEADSRVPELLATPAAIRFVSAEPLLGPIQFDDFCNGYKFIDALRGNWWHDDPNGPNPISRGHEKLDWIIVGGESGPGARPMHPAWARSIRDQCKVAGVAFFFKQWGAFRPLTEVEHGQACGATLIGDDPYDRDAYVLPATKKAAGRLLDGVEHGAFPDLCEVPFR